MPIAPLAVTRDRAKELDDLIALSEAEIAKLVTVFTAANGSFPKLAELTRLAREAIPADKADNVIRHLASLRRLADRKRASAEDTLAALEQGLQKFGWDKEKLDALRVRLPKFAEALKTNVIHNSYKVVDLYHDIRYHIHDIRVVTDLKPVFNEARSAIGCFIIHNVLTITYSDAFEGEQQVAITLDMEELGLLRDECERAILKTKTAQAELGGKMHAATIIYDD